MKRYLSPWIIMFRGTTTKIWRRYFLDQPETYVWASGNYDTLGHDCSSMEEAKASTDRYAVKQGYGFLMEEQWEKLKVLL